MIDSVMSVSSFIASIASLTLAVVAIWLAFKFYALSSGQAKDAERASKDISHSVDKLEKIFDRMYSDTFGMVQNMQEKIWEFWPTPAHANGSLETASGNEDEASPEDGNEVTPDSPNAGQEPEKPQTHAREPVESVHPSDQDLQTIDPPHPPVRAGRTMRDLRESELKRRNAASETEFLKTQIVRLLIPARRTAERGLSVRALSEMLDTSPGAVARMCVNLRSEGLVTWDRDSNRISTSDIVRIVPRNYLSRREQRELDKRAQDITSGDFEESQGPEDRNV